MKSYAIPCKARPAKERPHQAGAIIAARKSRRSTRVLTSLWSGRLSGAVQPGRDVAVPRVREHSDDDAFLDRAGQPSHRPESRAARVSDQQTLRACHGASEVVGGLSGASPDLVGKRRIPDLRHDRGRQVLEALEAVEGIFGLDGDGLDRSRVLFEPALRAHA